MSERGYSSYPVRFYQRCGVSLCVTDQVLVSVSLQGAHGPFRLAQELDSEWLMPTVRMTWGCIIYSQGDKRFVSKPTHLPEFQISSLELSPWFNKCLFSLTGIMATNHQRAGIKKKTKSSFLFIRDARVALLYSYNLVSRLNCTS